MEKFTDITHIKSHYGLALEEIKLNSTIKNMAVMLAGFHSDDKPKYLIDELLRQEEALKQLVELRSEKD